MILQMVERILEVKMLKIVVLHAILEVYIVKNTRKRNKMGGINELRQNHSAAR